MFDTDPPTHHDLIQRYQAQYDADLAAGNIEPFVYPWGTMGPAVVLVYLLIDHRKSRFAKYTRFLAFAINLYFAAWNIRHTRSRIMAPGLGIGILSAWGVLWIANLLIVNDAQVDFKRIARTEMGDEKADPRSHSKSASRVNVTALVDDSSIAQNGTVRNRHGAPSGSSSQPDGVEAKARTGKRAGTFYWQTYPVSSFIDRLDWVADAFSNFRGMGWNWRISGPPLAPRWVREQLHEHVGAGTDTYIGRDGTRRYETKEALIRKYTWEMIRGYCILDILKTVMVHDSYFWGLMERMPPSFLPNFIASSHVWLKTYRLVVSLVMIKTALQTIFALGPLFFAGVLGPEWIGAKAEPWLYPDTFGAFDNVWKGGLVGWWGGWWHQTFRVAFENTAKRIVTALGLSPKSVSAKTLQLFLAFTLSGTIHACGSYTQSGQTTPLRGPFAFFVLQAIGITAQTFVSGQLKKSGVTQKVPKVFWKVVNFAFVHVWFYYTSPLLVDDFAKGGIWLFEPIPISPLRGLGFGVKGDGWWCWGGRWAFWHTGKHWWQSGLAV
ncbi:hypothetical protein LTR04_001284 [Oleoguttula sp. CCFEE 6159]|nr:hypothetical protein LTR04_001284 [Oleoguttula sp. CCFEE 6159]